MKQLSHTCISIIVWCLRVIVGAVFMFSGWSKAVDPWGFMYKIEEYLEVWGLAWMPRQVDLCVGGLLALFEFTIGVALALGCMRRIAVWGALALMAFLLPLSVYIALANPVADCGCFGEALVISNNATLIKNIIITAMLVVLWKYNTAVAPLVAPLMQWVPFTASVLLCVIVSTEGYLVQPLVDFRPYKVGEPLLGHEPSASAMQMIYERDGQEKAFSLDALPDSTWTYVGRTGDGAAENQMLSIYDGEEDVTEWVISDEGPQLLLLVSNPAYHNRARASMSNRLSEYMQENGGEMIALLPLSDESLDAWREIASANYDTYTVEPTVIKEIARGDAALVYLRDGVVKWKYNLYSLPGDFPNEEMDSLETIQPVESSNTLKTLLIIWLIAIAIPIILSKSIPTKHKSSI